MCFRKNYQLLILLKSTEQKRESIGVNHYFGRISIVSDNTYSPKFKRKMWTSLITFSSQTCITGILGRWSMEFYFKACRKHYTALPIQHSPKLTKSLGSKSLKFYIFYTDFWALVFRYDVQHRKNMDETRHQRAKNRLASAL